ncbi:VOC family protein [Micromonospora sp. NPDC007271]|uniref:VOC family protein n=1 Tax=Micromonospora sp. NPDC007271 TaxID=3154587 RepID=UPI0033F7B27F
MFRQVIAHRWAPGTTADDRAEFAAAFEALREVPDVAALWLGEDTTTIDDNHDAVTIIDFPDYAAARRYVDSPLHKRFIADHASKAVTARTVVQVDWAQGEITGLHHLKLPVTDVVTSRTWYARAFGFQTAVEFTEDGVLRGVGLHHPASRLGLALREDPARARALAGFDTVCFAVGTRADLDRVLQRLNALGIAHTAPVAGHRGEAADIPDPDGHVVRLHTLT